MNINKIREILDKLLTLSFTTPGQVSQLVHSNVTI